MDPTLSIKTLFQPPRSAKSARSRRRWLLPILLASVTAALPAAAQAEPPSDGEGTVLPMPAPMASTRQAPPAVHRGLQTASGQGFGVSFDIAQLLSFAGRFRVEYAPRLDMHVAAIIGGGSPDREDLDRYTLVEAGLQGAFFFVGDRMRGIGAMGQALVRSADGERTGESGGPLPTSKVSGSAWMAHAGLMARIAARTGIFLEFDALYGYTHSEGTAVQGETSRTVTVAYPDSRFSLYVGWMQ